MKRKILGGCCVIILVLGVAGVVHGVSSYLSSFNATYGTSATSLNTCVLCHKPPGQSISNRNNYAIDYSNNGYSFPAIEPLDSDGDGFTNIVEINARTFPGDATSHPASVTDASPPVVTAFVIPPTSSTLTVAITTFTATDNVGVTGYMVTESATAPAAGAAGWSATAPASYTFTTAGVKTLFAWAKDAAGNVSTSLSASVTITLAVADTTPPTVTAFVVPATATSLTVAITTFTATDNVGVTGYMVTESATAPTAATAGWTATPPTSYAFSTAGVKTLFAWALDAAGNVSAALSASVTITLPDAIPPVVTAFVIPTTSSSLVIPISAFTATDNVGVTGYMVTTSSTPPAATDPSWNTTAPTSFTFTTTGAKTLFAWAKDAAGNVSASLSASITITLVDTVPPTVTAFVLGTSTGMTVPITTFTAVDDPGGSGVAGYLITENSAVPSPLLAQWTANPPSSFTFSSGGAKTLFAWAKDAANNVSATVVSAVVTITPTDTTRPTVTAFTIDASVNLQAIVQGIVIPIRTFTATDNVGVTGYLVTESATPPNPGASGWSATAPTAFTVITAGTKTLHGWAKDAAGNVSAEVSGSTIITLPNVYNPTNPTPNGSINVPLTPTLQITVRFPAPDGDLHRSTTWEISSDATFAADKTVFASDFDVVNLTALSIPTGTLQQNTTYFWRASTIDTSGDLSNPSPTASFTTVSVALDPAFNVVPSSITVQNSAQVTSLAALTPADGAVSPLLVAATAANPALNAGAAANLTLPGLMIAKEKGGATTDIVGITTDVGIRIDSLSTTDISDPSFTNGAPPADKSFPYGVVSFRVSDVSPGTPVTVKIYPATALPDNATWFKYSATRGWLRIDSTGTYDGSNNLLSVNSTFRAVNGHGELTIKDDDLTDNSAEVIGGKAVVLDPGGPAVPAAPAAPLESGGGSGSSCFIATAAFGSYLDPYVVTLRRFRDVFLLTNGAGRAFVNFYYRVSPPMARTIAASENLRLVARITLLPAIGFSALALKIGIFWTMLLTLAVLALGLIVLKKVRSHSCNSI